MGENFALQLNEDMVREDYQKKRDYIISDIKDKLKTRNVDLALELIDKYRLVASEDEEFRLLDEEAQSQAELQLKLKPIITKYEATPDDNYQQRYELLKQICEYMPYNPQYRDALDECEIKLGLKKSIIGEAVSGIFSGVSDYISQKKSERAERDIQRAALADEYNKDRDFIIQSLKDCLKSDDYQLLKEHKELVEKYNDVAYNDATFCTLREEVNNRYSKIRELEVLKTRLETLPADNVEDRYSLCNAILKIEPANEECQIEKRRCESALGLRPVVSSDLRLGRRTRNYLVGYYDSKGSELDFFDGVVVVNLHTHGISLKHDQEIYRIHYTQITTIKYDVVGLFTQVLATVAGAAVGFLLGGGLGDAVDGAEFGASCAESSDVLSIVYWDVNDDKSKKLIIRCNNKDEINLFINKYQREIDITKRTKREPEEEPLKEKTKSPLKTILCVAGVIILFIFIVSLCSTNDSDSKMDSVASNNIPVTKAPADTHNDIPENTWGSADFKCYINKSNTTLTVSGKKASEANVEISGIIRDKCDKVSIKFDNQPTKSVKCSIKEGDVIQITSDRKLIKNMRNSINMKVGIPTNNGELETIEYSLNGFSKACEWTASSSSK